MAKIEHAIGDTFSVNGQTYKVVKSKLCTGCAFDHDSSCMDNKLGSVGFCSSLYRNDHTDVIFVKVNSK